MASSNKTSKVQPNRKKGKSTKILMRQRQELIVYGYINRIIRQKRIKQIMPQEIINIIYTYSEYKDVALAILGAHNSGKSTLAAKILDVLGQIPQQKLENIVDSLLIPKTQQLKYAFFMDATNEERTHKRTMHGSCKYIFNIGRFKYTLIDIPGHRDYLKNAVRLLSMADAAILVIPMNNDDFETSVQTANTATGRIEGRTICHLRLCHVLGVEQIIIVFNKIDTFKTEIEAHERFVFCKEKITKILKRIGFKVKRIPFIPLSGYNGYNLSEYDLNYECLKWYKGFKIERKKIITTGFTLFDALRDVIDTNIRLFINGIDKPFKMSVYKIFKIGGIGMIFKGKIMSGTISIGQRIRFYPTMQWNGIVKSIQINFENTTMAECGSIVSISLLNLQCDDNIKKSKKNVSKVDGVNINDLRSQLLCIDDMTLYRIPPKICKKFTALIVVNVHPGNLKKAIRTRRRNMRWNRNNNNDELSLSNGYAPIVYVSTWRSPCVIENINWVIKKVDVKNKTKTENPNYIEKGDHAEVVFVPLKPFIVFPYDHCQYYGRMVVVDNFEVVLIGKITSVQYK